jgi:uncharacterized repeat protein (TIGR03803 family)
MNVLGKLSVFLRGCRLWGNSMRRVALCGPYLCVSLTFAAVFAVNSAAGATLATVALFQNTNGANPIGGVIADASGNLYGTTQNGGAFNDGTVFQVAGGTHAISTLVSFKNSNGAYPTAGLIADAAGNLYGTTQSGGANGVGVVFEVAAGTHALSTLATFNNVNGAVPKAGLIADAAGNLYGTTQSGGANGVGTVFEVGAGTHALSTLATFDNSNGAAPFAGLVADTTGNLYGTTYRGGANDAGTVFQVVAGTHVFSTLATFNGSNGANPFGVLIADTAGNLYGTTFRGGVNNGGTVFEVAAGTHLFATLASFDVGDGYGPVAGLTVDAAGNLYGTTYGGGPNNYGMVFEIAAGTHAPLTLALFDGSDGLEPHSVLIADAAGNLYGTTGYGGPHNFGTVFELAGTGFVASAPEPAAASLIALIALGLLVRRRRGHY